MEALWLVRNGVPFDVALRMDERLRAACSIIFSTFDGGEFDWNAWAFKRKDGG